MWFNLSQKKNSKNPTSDNLLLGNLLIVLSLLCDGLLGATEDRMRSICKPTALHFMYYLNLWSVGFGLLGFLVFNEGPQFIEFTTRHPEILKYFPLAVAVGTVGQFFINSMLSNFGPLPLSIATTVRKLISVVLSAIVFLHQLAIQQWIAASLVFGVLIMDAVMNRKKPVKSAEIENEPEEEILEHKQDVLTKFVEVKEKNGIK